ncbi:MAG: hypothetical protein L6R39_005838 [Caloplaca ligustica]|nr:MAG: hypothetical protein L6R39_005838 [Caloplaca ligustica]
MAPYPGQMEGAMLDDHNLDGVSTNTPSLSEEAFSQLLHDFIADSEIHFPTEIGLQEQTAQQCPPYYHPAANDRWQPYTTYPAHQTPVPHLPAPRTQPSCPSSSANHPPNIPRSTPDGALEDSNPSDAAKESDQMPKEAGYISKRAAKRAKLEAENVDFGSEFRKKGEVEYIDGQLHFKVYDELKPAVYHHQLRAEYIAKAPPELYVHPPKRGRDEADVTSFYKGHRDWSFATREGRPEICFQWLPTNEIVTAVPGPMMHNGRIVIDTEGHPVRDWPIPACLSSEVEGGRLEAMSRENGNRISKRDFRARMPPKVLKKDGGWKDLMGETAIGMRRIRFRHRAGLLAHHQREGSREKKKALVQCIPADTMSRILVENSVRCWRDMTEQEIIYMERVSVGQHLNKAGSQRLTDEVRKDRMMPNDLKMMDFKPVNEEAWPYINGIDDDDAAVSAARIGLGLPPFEPRLLPASRDTLDQTYSSFDTHCSTEGTMDQVLANNDSFQYVQSQTASPRPQPQRSVSEGKKRPRDDGADAAKPDNRKRRRNSAAAGGSDFDRPGYSSCFSNDTSTDTRRTWSPLLTVPAQIPEFDPEWDNVMQSTDPFGHEAIVQATASIPSPILRRHLDDFFATGQLSFRQAAELGSVTSSSINNPQESMQRMSITSLPSSGPAPLNTNHEVIPATAMSDEINTEEESLRSANLTAPLDLDTEAMEITIRDWVETEYVSQIHFFNFGDGASSLAPGLIVDQKEHGGALGSEADEEEDVEPSNDLHRPYISPGEITNPTLDISTSRPSTKENDGGSKEVDKFSVPRQAVTIPYADIELDEDGYPIYPRV